MFFSFLKKSFIQVAICIFIHLITWTCFFFKTCVAFIFCFCCYIMFLLRYMICISSVWSQKGIICVLKYMSKNPPGSKQTLHIWFHFFALSTSFTPILSFFFFFKFSFVTIFLSLSIIAILVLTMHFTFYFTTFVIKVVFL